MTGALKAGSTSEELKLTATVSGMLGVTPVLTIADADGKDATAKFTVSGLKQIDKDEKFAITPVVNVKDAAAGKYVLTLTVGGEKVVRNFEVAATVKVGVAAKNATEVDGDTAATIAEVAAQPKKVGETVEIVVANATTLVQKNSTYVLTYNTNKTLEATASENGTVTFTYTVTDADVKAGQDITLTATKIAAKP